MKPTESSVEKQEKKSPITSKLELMSTKLKPAPLIQRKQHNVLNKNMIYFNLKTENTLTSISQKYKVHGGTKTGKRNLALYISSKSVDKKKIAFANAGLGGN